MALTAAADRHEAMTELVRLPFGCDPSEVLEVVERDGGVILTGVLTREEVDAVNRELDPHFDRITKPKGDGEKNYLAKFGGFRTKRLTHCVKHSPIYRERFVADERWPAYVAARLGGRPGSHTLFASQGIQIMPGEQAQELHRDGRGFLDKLGILPNSGVHIMVNTLLALTDVTEEMGATRIVPGSHKWTDLKITGNERSIPVLLKKGEAFFYTGHVIHGGGANTTEDQARRLIATVWSLPFLVGEEAWPFIFSVDEVRSFSPLMQGYLGFRSICYRGEEPGFLWRVDGKPLETMLELDSAAR